MIYHVGQRLRPNGPQVLKLSSYLNFNQPFSYIDDEVHGPVTMTRLLPTIYHARCFERSPYACEYTVLFRYANDDVPTPRAILELAAPIALAFQFLRARIRSL